MRSTGSLFALCCLLSTASAQWESDVRLTNEPANSFLCGQQCIVAEGDTLHVIFTDNRSGWATFTTPAQPTRAPHGTARSASARATRMTSSARPSRRPAQTCTSSGKDRPTALSSTGARPTAGRRGCRRQPRWSRRRAPRRSSQPTATTSGWHGAIVATAAITVKLYYKQSVDGGSNWTDDTRLTVDTDSVADREACLVVSGNHRYIVWTRWHWRTSASQTWFRRSTNNGASWEPRARITADTTNQSKPMVAAVGPNVHVCWYDGRPGGYGIYYRGSTDNGGNLEFGRYLTDTTDFSDFPCIAAAGGNVHVAHGRGQQGSTSSTFAVRPTTARHGRLKRPLTTVAGEGTSTLAAEGNAGPTSSWRQPRRQLRVMLQAESERGRGWRKERIVK